MNKDKYLTEELRTQYENQVITKFGTEFGVETLTDYQLACVVSTIQGA